MDFDFTPEDEAFRAELRAFLDEVEADAIAEGGIATPRRAQDVGGQTSVAGGGLHEVEMRGVRPVCRGVSVR